MDFILYFKLFFKNIVLLVLYEFVYNLKSCIILVVEGFLFNYFIVKVILFSGL